MIRLVVLGGTGDVYLICGLVEAFRQHHRRGDVSVVVRPKFAPVAELLFPEVPLIRDEALVYQAENDRHMQITSDNFLRLDEKDSTFFTHPCFERSRVRVDHLTTKPDVSQADMYRMLLRLPADARLAAPLLPKVQTEANSVLLIPDAVSWPNTQPKFWQLLEAELRAHGRDVWMNTKAWGIEQLFTRCAQAEWVIGPQCGVMSILCTGGFPCRKTLATPSVDDERAPGFLAAQTFPYAYVTKFANLDYDVEEFKVTLANRAEVVAAIVKGSNALRLWPHRVGPINTLMLPTTPGEALDRLAILTVKRDRFPPMRRAAIEREYQRHHEVCRRVRLDPRVEGMFQQMVTLHERTFDLLETVVPDEMVVENSPVAMNRARIDLKREVDALCNAPYREVKSYYGPDGF